MKKQILIILCLLAPALYVAGQESIYRMPENGRVVKTINTEWTFNYFPAENADKSGCEAVSYDDSQWPCVSVPHTWQTYETTKELHPYIRNISAKDDPYWWNGWGWYRKHIVIGKELEGQKVCFEFDGVQKYSKIYLNGKYLGDHKGGFTSFYMDATEAVNFGGDNVLVVAVNNALHDQFNIAPMNAGNWAVYGGIIRDVRLVVTDKLSVPFQGSYKHEGGTFITTPVVSKDAAQVKVRSYVMNSHSSAKEVKVATVLTDKQGRVVERVESRQTVKPGEIGDFLHEARPISRPYLWTPETPYIYNAYTEVYDGDRLTDVYHSTFGIRSIDWDYDAKRLILNGNLYHLHGINRHEEYIWLGQAFPKWVAERDMMDMRYGLDVNYMRTAHYPNDPQVYYFMDEHGVFLNEELPNIKNQEFDPVVQEQNCREMIRRDRNHPSIIIWSMGNETDHPCDSRFAWEEDTTRIITVRQPYTDAYNPEFCKHTDAQMPVESYLRCTIRGWYDTDDRNLEPSDGQWAGTDSWQHQKSREGKTISHHNGTVWLYADHGADREYVGAPLKHVNPKGWVDSWRTPKYVYYLWQANFGKTPMVHIQPHFWRSQYVGQRKDFIVDSNCEEVELLVNGKSYGKLKPSVDNNFNVCFENVKVEQGVIEAIATKGNGTRVTDRVVMSGEPARLTISPTRNTMMSTTDNIIEVKVDIVDSEGVHVYGANNPLRFTVDGPARLIGPDMYISDREKHEEYEGTMYIDAPVTNLIRATGQTGSVKVTVSSPGLESASVTIDVLEYVDPNPVAGISEPKLDKSGRKDVAVNTLKANFVKAPVEMKHYAGEVSIPAKRQKDYRKLAQEFIMKENPGMDTSSPDFGYVLDAFVAILNSTTVFTGDRGYVVADDYNFIADQFNVSRAITKNIASKNLPAAYKAMLVNYYAQNIVSRGNDKNYMAENELIDLIPAGGKVVYTGAKYQGEGDAVCIMETDLKKIVSQVRPEIAGWSKDDQKRALTLITRINPGVTFKSIRNKKDKTRTDSYTVEPGSIILIPEVDVLKKYKFPEVNL